MTDTIWLTPTYPWPERPIAGIFFRTQARALVRAGLRVTVACPTPLAPWPLSRLNGRWRAYARAPRLAVDEGVTVVRPRYPNLPGEPRYALPDRLIARATWGRRRDWRGARLVHGHYAVTGMAAQRLARRAGLPLVLTFHGSDINRWPDDHPDQLQALRSLVHEASAVIAVSAALAARVQSLTGRTPLHLPIGVDHRVLAAAALPAADARRVLGLPLDRLIVLYVGNLVAAKGVPELAHAIVELGDPFVGVFVGDGPEALRLASGSTDRLRFVGGQGHDRVVQYMSAADVLVLPSRGEGLPTVVVEAGSLELPVIASDVGGIPELLGGGRGTLLGDVSSRSIAAALTAFAARRDEAAAAARALSLHVHSDYDVDRNAARLIETYREIAPSLRCTTDRGVRVASSPAPDGAVAE